MNITKNWKKRLSGAKDQIVEVTWMDACGKGGYVPGDLSARPHGCVMQDVGYLLSWDENFIIVSPERDGESEGVYRDRTEIPSVLICGVRKLQ